jgi:hypothetical protein
LVVNNDYNAIKVKPSKTLSFGEGRVRPIKASALTLMAFNT